MKIEDMPAGREMDALIEQVVFGHETAKWRCYHECDGWYISYDGDGELQPVYLARPHDAEYDNDKLPRIGGRSVYCYEAIPNYSQNAGEAWKVVLHLNSLLEPLEPYAFFIASDVCSGIYCAFANSKAHIGHKASTIPLAICRAALIVCGITETPDGVMDKNREMLHGDGKGEL